MKSLISWQGGLTLPKYFHFVKQTAVLVWLEDGHALIRALKRLSVCPLPLAVLSLIAVLRAGTRGRRVIALDSPQKFREFLEGSNLISKLQAKHDLLKKTLGDGKLSFLTMP